jgi:pimeloyl-ACP methyl ester carboxylesterase
MLTRFRRKRPPFPARPTRPGLVEPSLDWTLQAVVAALGADRAMTPQLRNRLAMCGIPWPELEAVLRRVRTVESWSREMIRGAEKAESAGDYARAAAYAFLGQLVVSPHHPVKKHFQKLLRENHLRHRQTTRAGTAESVSLVGGRVRGIYERPARVRARPVVLFPPLASTKEELVPLADPLLEAGHPVLRLDMPGQGESPAPLEPESERLLRSALDEMGYTASEGVFLGGISLGSYYALRIAATDPERVCAVFAVSPPAIVTGDDWARQMEIIWQYLDIYFDTPTREETHRIALNLHLNGLGERVTCPVLMYHGTRDRINVPDARERYREILASAPLTDYLLPDIHACPWHLGPRIGPEAARWLGAMGDDTNPRD